MHDQPVQSNRPRDKVVFEKTLKIFKPSATIPDFRPSAYAVTHLAFNSAMAEYVVIPEDEVLDDR